MSKTFETNALKGKSLAAGMKQRIAELEKYGVDEEVSKSVIDVLDKCEFAQYAPELSGNDMGDVLQHAADVMDQLENTKKKK